MSAEKDPIAPPGSGRAIANGIPGARYIEIAGAYTPSRYSKWNDVPPWCWNTWQKPSANSRGEAEMLIARIFVALWFLLSLGLSLAGWFEQFSSPTLFGIGAVAASIGFAVLHSRFEQFRGFVRVRSLKRITIGQTLRFYGILAFYKAYHHILPVSFAVPTGIIDVVFAASSFFVAARLVSADGKPKPGFAAWHILGLAGLATSAILAVLTSSNRFGMTPNGITSQTMTQFPISLVPTFIGPLVLVFHLVALTAGHPPKK